MEQSLLFLEFEAVLAVAVALVVVLIILFYVIYPYDKDIEQGSGEP